MLPLRACDVFNGDADGICALHQLRLDSPQDSMLITGCKRDIDLLHRVPAEPCDVTVLDISLDRNADALQRLLDTGSRVRYYDHHSARKVFTHPRLSLFHDDSPKVCTGMLVDRQLGGRYRQWAVTAAFGDNLPTVAHELAQQGGLSADETQAAKVLGFLLNYNAYGESVEDLHIAPDQLFRALSVYFMPSDFIADAPQYAVLADGYRADEGHLHGIEPVFQAPCGAIFMLPCRDWARRVSGVFANRLITGSEGRAFAVLTENRDGSFTVSMPESHAASAFCEQFAGGGGRRAAAGINRLPESELDRFIRSFADYFLGMGTSQAARVSA